MVADLVSRTRAVIFATQMRALLIMAVGMAGVSLGLVGCGQNDLGVSCVLKRPVDDGQGGVTVEDFIVDASEVTDFVSTGPGCDDFHCVDSRYEGTRNTYCSKRCNADVECRGGVDDRLVCREMVLDSDFINQLKTQLGEEEFRRLFGDIQTSRFCALPREG